jgi:hypothetical protein
MKWTFVVCGLALTALLSSCPQNNQMAGGQARVLSSVSEPNLTTCPVISNDYILLKGENLGVAADWKSGANKVIFFDNVTVPASDVELTQEGNPGTLILKVPATAQTGPLVVEVGGIRSAPIEVKVTDVRTMQAVGECVYPPAPVR